MWFSEIYLKITNAYCNHSTARPRPRAIPHHTYLHPHPPTASISTAWDEQKPTGGSAQTQHHDQTSSQGKPRKAKEILKRASGHPKGSKGLPKVASELPTELLRDTRQVQKCPDGHKNAFPQTPAESCNIYSEIGAMGSWLLELLNLHFLRLFLSP